MAHEGDGSNGWYASISSIAVDRAIAGLAAKQYGNVTRQQLDELGLGSGAIAHRARTGRLFRVHRSVYAVGRPPFTPLERASAAVLACGAGAALSHGSAMTLWGYWKRWDEPFEVSVTKDRRTRGVMIHRSKTLHRRDIRTHLGIRVTSPARTLFDVSHRLSDRALKRQVNNALHSPWLSEGQLAETVARLHHLPPAPRIARMLGLGGTPTRSGWEDDFPDFCAQHRLPAPVMGAVVGGYIVDALFPAEKVIVELDSWEFHKGAIAFETDRERDAETLVRGYVTVRITGDRMHAREAGRLRKILSQRQAPRAA